MTKLKLFLTRNTFNSINFITDSTSLKEQQVTTMKKHNKNEIHKLKKDLNNAIKDGKTAASNLSKTKEGTEDYEQWVAEVQANKELVSELKGQILELQNMD